MVAFHSGSDDDKFDTIVLRMPGETTGIFNDYKRETEFIGIQVRCYALLTRKDMICAV